MLISSVTAFPFPSFGGRAWETSCDIILFVFLGVLFVLLLVLLVVVALPLEDTRGTLGCSLFTTHVDGSNAPGTLEEEYLRWWLLVSLTSRGKSLSANLEELSSPDPDPVGAAGFEKNSSGVGQAAAVAQMASNQKSQHLPFVFKSSCFYCTISGWSVTPSSQNFIKYLQSVTAGSLRVGQRYIRVYCIDLRRSDSWSVIREAAPASTYPPCPAP